MSYTGRGRDRVPEYLSGCGASRKRAGFLRVYAIKLFWPTNLAVFYPYSRQSLAVPAAFAALGLVAITVMAVRTRARRPYLIVGWAWYLVTLAPVIGLIQVGAQARADRYTYIPMIGLSIALVWGAAEILQPWPSSPSSLSLVCLRRLCGADLVPGPLLAGWGVALSACDRGNH